MTARGIIFRGIPRWFTCTVSIMNSWFAWFLRDDAFETKEQQLLLLLCWHIVSVEYPSVSINELRENPSGKISRAEVMTKILSLRASSSFCDSIGHVTSWVFSKLPWPALFSTFHGAIFLYFHSKANTTLIFSCFTFSVNYTISCLWLRWFFFFFWMLKTKSIFLALIFPLKAISQIVNTSHISIHGWPIDFLNLTFQKWMLYLLSKPDGHIILAFHSFGLKMLKIISNYFLSVILYRSCQIWSVLPSKSFPLQSFPWLCPYLSVSPY